MHAGVRDFHRRFRSLGGKSATKGLKQGERRGGGDLISRSYSKTVPVPQVRWKKSEGGACA